MLDYISSFSPPETVIITGFEGYIIDEEAERYYEEQQAEIIATEYRETEYSKWLKANCPF